MSLEFEREERKITKLFEGFVLEDPPETLMKNYLVELEEKIAFSEKRRFWLGAGFFALGLGFSVLLVYLFLLRPLGIQKEAEAPAPAASAGDETFTPRGAEMSGLADGARADLILTTDSAEALAEELLILEMLGEAENLFDPTDRLNTDLAVLDQLGAVS